MSHKATNWAIQQRGLKPATKILLWHLADCHNPAHGCFPSQEYLAEHAEMSERSVRSHLEKLEELGLISRVKVKDKGLFAHTEYALNFDLILLPPAKFSGGKNASEPPAKFSATHRQNLPPNLVIDNPVKEHSNTPLPPKDRVCEILCTVMSEESAQAFIEHRKHKRSKLTERAAQLIAKKLAGNQNADAIIEKSIMNGWTGVFPESFKSDEGNNTHGKSKHDGAAISRAERAQQRQRERYAEKQRRLDIGQDRNPSQPLLPAGQPGRGVRGGT